jgi:hypothetical protein
MWTKFKAHHKWSTDEMEKMLGETGFKVLSSEYSPKYIAAFVYEFGLFFTSVAPERIAKRLVFIATPAMYLLSKLDYILPRNIGGSEFIMNAIKLSCKTGR